MVDDETMARQPKVIRQWKARAAVIIHRAGQPVPERPADAWLAIRALGKQPPHLRHAGRQSNKESREWWGGPRVPLEYAVEVMAELDAWCFCGGWGDGPCSLQPGARLWLAYKQGKGEHIYFTGGDGQGEILGWFSGADLKLVRPY